MDITRTLDNLIAVAVVILILSLIVQSTQAAIKKCFKLKSKQIEDSLVDLFEAVLNKPRKDTPKRPFALMRNISDAVMRTLGMRATWQAAYKGADDDVRMLYTDVIQAFGNVGRVDQWGHPALNTTALTPLNAVRPHR